MSRKLIVLLVANLIVSVIACGDDDDSKLHDAGAGGANAAAGKGGAGGSAGKSGAGGAAGKSAGTGGKSGSGGGAAGGGGASGSAADVYTCKPAAAEPGGNKAEGDACCSGMGTCTKNPNGAAAAGYGLDQCKAGSDLKCVPALGAGADDGGAAELKTCQVDLPANLIGDVKLEGRCIPGCFVTGDPSSGNLGQASCDSGSKCVPCYSPITGKSTGACEQSGDKPAQPAPAGFPSCGDSDVGYCIGSGAAATSGNVMLPQLNCADGQVCAPKLRVLDQHACFAHCESGVGGPGACIAGFIVPEMSRSFLSKVTCTDGELCVPCVSPLDMTSTGACM